MRIRPQAPRARRLWVLVLLVAVAATGCASSLDVAAKSQIAAARYAILDAETQEAQLYAPEEIELARHRLEEAQAATPDVGIQLAEQATVNAQLASAIASRESAQAQLAEARRVQRAAGTLRVETIEAVEATQ